MTYLEWCELWVEGHEEHSLLVLGQRGVDRNPTGNGRSMPLLEAVRARKGAQEHSQPGLLCMTTVTTPSEAL